MAYNEYILQAGRHKQEQGNRTMTNDLLVEQMNAETSPIEAAYNAAVASAYSVRMADIPAYNAAVASAEFAYDEQTAPIYAKYQALLNA